MNSEWRDAKTLQRGRTRMCHCSFTFLPGSRSNHELSLHSNDKGCLRRGIKKHSRLGSAPRTTSSWWPNALFVGQRPV